MDEVANEHLWFWPRYFTNAPPRTLNFEDARPPALIFTDGAEENGVVGVGGVLLDESVIGNEFFGGVVGDTIVEAWMKAGEKRRVIHQTEVYPAAIAMDLWASRLRGRSSHLRRQRRGQRVLDQGHWHIHGLREVGHRLLVQGSQRGAVHLD